MDKKLEEKLTNGGRVPLPIGVNKAKLVAADQIIEGINKGDSLAIGAFKEHLGARFSETLTTGDDFIYAFSHMTALEVDNEWVARERNWKRIMPTRVVNTFEGAKVYSIDPTVTGFNRPSDEPGKPGHVAPIVPENAPYPEFKFTGEEASGGGIHKAGGAFGLSFERIVSNPGELVPVLPMLITEFLLDREEWDAFNGLISFLGAAQQLTAGTTLDGAAVLKNAPLGRDSLNLAIEQVKRRKLNKRALGISTMTLVVPIGGAETAKWYINTLTPGAFTTVPGSTGGTERSFTLNGYNPLATITDVVESEYIADNAWYLIPTPGSIRGNKRFIELGVLRGHEAPEIRTENVTGNYLGGGAVGPFEGSFATDSARLRGRIITGALQWSPEFGIWSNGTSA